MTIIDMHAHLETRMLEIDRAIAKMDAAGIDRVVLIPAMNDPLPHTPEHLLSIVRWLMRRDRARPIAERLNAAFMTKDGDLKLSGVVHRIYARPDNAAVSEAIAKHPTRFRGWIFLNPANDPDVLESLERWRNEPGRIGIKLHPHWHRYPTSRAKPLLRRAEELGLPVLIHFGFGAAGDFIDLCSSFPKLVIIAAHAGFPFYDALWRKGREHRNLLVDLSSPYIDEKLARDAVAALGADRCLYGTDAPYGFHDTDGSYDYGRIRGWVERMPIRTDEREKIFHGNFARFDS
jgi:predicted TIM-barrel fold metal-dependent hydrolase